MSNIQEYNSRIYQVPKEVLRSLSDLKSSVSVFALVKAWLSLAVLILVMRSVIPANRFWIFYVPVAFLIASRYGVLLQLIHEASHHLLSRNRKLNDFWAIWLCSSPIGISFEGYAKGHMRHHAWTNTENDPKSDTEKYRSVDFRKFELYMLLFKDLLGLTAFQIFFEYRDYEESPHEPKPPFWSKLIALSRMALCQIVILTVLFQWDIRDYILLWIIPAISPHMFLMRIRGIAEHGLAAQLGVTVNKSWEGSYYTRSFLTPRNQYSFKPFSWMEKLLVATLNANYHHEHHLFPSVPFYHLPDLHRRVSEQVRRLNPDAYAKGYFAAAFKMLLDPIAVQHPTLQLHST